MPAATFQAVAGALIIMTELYIQIVSFENFWHAAKEVERGKQTQPQFCLMQVCIQRHLVVIIYQLIYFIYHHQGVSRFIIREPKRREIAAPFLRDRIVHHALVRQTLSYFERYFCECSFACRKGKEQIIATINLSDGSRIQRVFEAGRHYQIGLPYSKLKQILKDDIIDDLKNDGKEAVSIGMERKKGRGSIFAVYYWQELIRKAIGIFGTDFYVIDVDMKSFFRSINHDLVKILIAIIIKEPDVRWLYGEIINSYEEDYNTGIPIGFLTSQHIANLVGSVFDHFIKDILGIKCYIRYMDDLRLCVGTYEEARNILYALDALACRMKLTLSPNKTHIRKWKGSDTFCGFVVRPHKLSPKASALKHISKRLAKQHGYLEEGYMTAEQFYSSAMNAKTYIMRTDHPVDERVDRWLSI